MDGAQPTPRPILSKNCVAAGVTGGRNVEAGPPSAAGRREDEVSPAIFDGREAAAFHSDR